MILWSMDFTPPGYGFLFFPGQVIPQMHWRRTVRMLVGRVELFLQESFCFTKIGGGDVRVSKVRAREVGA